MIKVTASLNNKVEEFYMVTQEQLDSAIDILDQNGYVIIMVESK